MCSLGHCACVSLAVYENIIGVGLYGVGELAAYCLAVYIKLRLDYIVHLRRSYRAGELIAVIGLLRAAYGNSRFSAVYGESYFGFGFIENAVVDVHVEVHADIIAKKQAVSFYP